MFEGGIDLQDYIEERVLETAQYIIDKGATVREAAKVFKISKSTVHKDMSDRLPRMNSSLYRQVHQVLEHNKAERHIRGGMATYRKYKGALT